MKPYLLKHKALLATALLFSFTFSAGNAVVALILRDVTNIAVSGSLTDFLPTLIRSAVFFLLLGVCYLCYALLSKKFICRVTADLRLAVFDGVFQRNMADFHTVNSADYLSALTNDIKLVEDNFLLPLLLSIQYSVIFLSALAVMVYLSPIVTLCLLVTLVFLVVIPALLSKALQNSQSAFSQKLSQLTAKTKDLLLGFEIIKSYRLRHLTGKDFQAKNRETREAKYTVDKLYALNESISMLLGVVSQVSVIFLSAYLIITGDLTPGSMIGLIQVSGMITAPIQLLSENTAKIQSAKPVIQRLTKLASYEDTSFTGNEIPQFNRQIKASNLSFSYGGTQVLKDLNLTLEKNKKYALTGKSGSGKTTLIKLLAGYYAEYQGKITYDGTDILQTSPDALAELTSLIHQNVYMFDETILDNIALHTPTTGEEIQSAADDSGVSLFLPQTPQGLSSPTGENGAKLSGGQRQRIAVARAILKKKPILILDEGTSAIDVKTASDIESRLLARNDLTLITITHNMSSPLLARYDEILYLEDGVLKEQGPLSQLISSQGPFSRFYETKQEQTEAEIISTIC